jgi:hypothetical protein
MKNLPAIFIIILFCKTVAAQNVDIVDTATANALISKCAQTFPKFYREFQHIKTHDDLIKRFTFIKTTGPDNGPAFAYPNGVIRINVKYLESQQPTFDDNRLIVVLYHEIGHLHYFMNTPLANRNSQDSEQAAFEYSLLKTKQMAEAGDCLPLKTGLRFMKLRSESDNLQDPHVRALKIIVKEPLYLDYLKYAKEKCGDIK